MRLYQIIREQAPNACGLMLYLIELAETDKRCFNSVSWAIRENRIPLDMEVIKLHVENYRGRKQLERETMEAYKSPMHRRRVQQLSKQQQAQQAELDRLIAEIDKQGIGGAQVENNLDIYPGRSAAGPKLGADNP